jgi:hypothetical protein
MPSYFRTYGRATGDPRWDAVTGAVQATVASLQTNYSPVTGLLPDFIVSANTAPRPAPAGFLEGPNDGAYNYNACRDPLRIGLDGILNGDPASIAQVRKISAWAQSATGGDPAALRAGYRLDGTPLAGSDYFTTAFVAPMGVAAMNDPAQQVWLNRIYDSVYTAVEDYYEDSLNLLSLIAISGNFWDPTPGAAPPVETVSLRADADAHVRAGVYANRNYGAAAQLTVRNHSNNVYDHQAFLRFDLTGVSGDLRSAVLKLTPAAIGSQMKSIGEFRVRLLADPADGWVEGNGGTDNKPARELRWNNKPTGTGTAIRVLGSQLAANRPVAIDVTSLVTQLLNANGIASFHLDVPVASASRYVTFFSDESSTAAFRPVLEVTTAAAATFSPEPTATAAFSPEPNATVAGSSWAGAALGPPYGLYGPQSGIAALSNSPRLEPSCPGAGRREASGLVPVVPRREELLQLRRIKAPRREAPVLAAFRPISAWRRPG